MGSFGATGLPASTKRAPKLAWERGTLVRVGQALQVSGGRRAANNTATVITITIITAHFQMGRGGGSWCILATTFQIGQRGSGLHLIQGFDQITVRATGCVIRVAAMANKLAGVAGSIAPQWLHLPTPSCQLNASLVCQQQATPLQLE
jgi:hypothetical protein